MNGTLNTGAPRGPVTPDQEDEMIRHELIERIAASVAAKKDDQLPAPEPGADLWDEAEDWVDHEPTILEQRALRDALHGARCSWEEWCEWCREVREERGR